MMRRIHIPLGIRALALGCFLLLGALAVLLRIAPALSPFLLPFATYLPYLAAAYLVLLLAGCLFGEKKTFLPCLITLLLSAVLIASILWTHIWRSLAPPEPGMFRVATWNVFRCKRGIPLVRRSIAELGADILAIQEIIDAESDVSRPLQLASLVEPLGYTWQFVGYTAGRESPQAGIAVCVREPVRLLRVSRRTYHPSGKWSYAFAETQVDGHVLNVVIPHLYPFALETTVRRTEGGLARKISMTARRIFTTTHWHRQEVEELLRLVSTFKDPTIVLGDFNSAPTHPIHWRLRKHMNDCLAAAGKGLCPTYVFGLPIRIDYIYVTPSLRIHDARVLKSSGSDHRPVVAALSFSNED